MPVAATCGLMGYMRQLPFFFAIGLMAAPAAADEARGRVRHGSAARRQGRRAPVRVTPLRSPCGRHLAEFHDGALFVDGRRVQASPGAVELVAQPAWRRDGTALAWIEREGAVLRLMVLPEVAPGTEPMTWQLPLSTAGGQVYWAGSTRVVVGPSVFEPIASASWTEER